MDLRALGLDDAWLACLDDVARETGLALGPERLAAAVRDLSDAYNTGAFARARTKSALAARLLFSFPRDVPKIGAAVRELVAAKAIGIPECGVLRVLDVGAGLGASTYGFARVMALAGERGAVVSTCVDDDEGALAVARAIARARTKEGDIDVRVATVPTRPKGARFDVILVGQSLGEIDPDEDRQAALLGSLLDDALEPHGSLVVVEPALRDRTRRLHRVRDRLLARANPPVVFAPCLHALACPALADPQAWCHEDISIDLPRRVAAIARAAGLRWQGLTFSYLVLRKDGVTLRAHVPEHAHRVVSQPIVTKGKRELFLCADGVRRKVYRLDRDGTKRDAWAEAQRGDVLTFEPPLDAPAIVPMTALRVPAGTKITSG